jgi:hypothetical protein
MFINYVDQAYQRKEAYRGVEDHSVPPTSLREVQPQNHGYARPHIGIINPEHFEEGATVRRKQIVQSLAPDTTIDMPGSQYPLEYSSLIQLQDFHQESSSFSSRDPIYLYQGAQSRPETQSREEEETFSSTADTT